MPTVTLNLAAWIERRKSDVGPYADHIIHSVRAYEAEIEKLRETVAELDAAAEAEAQKYEDYAVRGTDLTP